MLPPSFLAPCLGTPELLKCFGLPSARSLTTAHRLWGLDRRQMDVARKRKVKLRISAHQERRKVLKEERARSNGDPIRGIETDFVRSMDNLASPDSHVDTAESSLLSHGISELEFQTAMRRSRDLSRPTEQSEAFTAQDSASREAVRRIVALSNASSRHRTKDNIQRVVETFGRHNTDQFMRPKAPSVDTPATATPATPRAGPDTGSSEVQIGVLTAKIRVLANRLEAENKNDNINRRNLRLLVHRRQKLLKYMYRKERGSERWQHVIAKLGLTPATWMGEIQF